MFFLVVNAMNYSITGHKDKKFLLWTLYDINEEEEEEKLKVEEFRVCDCFLDWTLSYRHRFNDDLYDEWRLVDFFTEIPSDHISSDIYAMFGTTAILCCQKPLYYFSYMDDIDHDYFLKKCHTYQIDMRCMFFLEKVLFFKYICSKCQINFIKAASKKFIEIKND